jgi:hypothetical protein
MIKPITLKTSTKVCFGLLENILNNLLSEMLIFFFFFEFQTLFRSQLLFFIIFLFAEHNLVHIFLWVT